MPQKQLPHPCLTGNQSSLPSRRMMILLSLKQIILTVGTLMVECIHALQTFCERRHIPLERAHFHIGENYTGPRAFGIYKDEYGFFTVYKNKSDGSRLVRYHGIDEDFAVNEIFQKLRSEVLVKKR